MYQHIITVGLTHLLDPIRFSQMSPLLACFQSLRLFLLVNKHTWYKKKRKCSDFVSYFILFHIFLFFFLSSWCCRKYLKSEKIETNKIKSWIILCTLAQSQWFWNVCSDYPNYDLLVWPFRQYPTELWLLGKTLETPCLVTFAQICNLFETLRLTVLLLELGTW